MFGYLTPNRDELRVRELRLYRAHYCGVCRAMKQHCAARCCLCLAYDSAFLSLLGDLLWGITPIKEARCPFKPWKKLFAVECPAAVYAAKANAYLGYLKCLDDRADEHPLRGAAGARLFRRPAAGAKAALSAAAEQMEEGMRALSALERGGCAQMDEPAIAFGRVTAGLFGGLPLKEGCEKYREALLWMGQNIGRWVYLLDAFDDLDDDEKSGSYNVLLRQFGSAQEAKAQRGRLQWGLEQSLYQAHTAFSLLPENDLTPVVENILRQGAPLRADAVLAGTKKEKKGRAAK